MEDIPPGIVAILTPSGVDVLSHIGIRARTQKVLLASCHDAGIFSALVGANQGHEFAKVALDSPMQVSCPLSLAVACDVRVGDLSTDTMMSTPPTRRLRMFLSSSSHVPSWIFPIHP